MRPAESIQLLRERQPPKPSVPVAKLIAELASDKFATREAATRQLMDCGPEVAVVLYRAYRNEMSAESRKRLDRILANFKPIPRSEELRNRRIVHVLENCATPDALALLREHAAGTQGTALADESRAALARLAGRK